MTVKEVFDLRKQGKIEEAYEAIRPMYAVHQGRYTTLCMFWTASDILKKRIEEKRIGEAEKIFEALLRVLPNIDDKDGKAHSAILHDALRLSDESQNFRMLDFVANYGVEKLTDADWEGGMSTPKEGSGEKPHPLPSTAQRMLTHCFREIQQHPDSNHAQKMLPLLQEALRRTPRNKNNQRYMAVVCRITGEREKAATIYHQLLSRHHDSYLYAELAELTEEPGQKAALYCRAIRNQRQEKFRTGYRFELARLLLNRDNPKAAHELKKCVEARKSLGYHLTREMQQMLTRLKDVQPATEAEQQDFYRRMMEKFPIPRV